MARVLFQDHQDYPGKHDGYENRKQEMFDKFPGSDKLDKIHGVLLERSLLGVLTAM